MIILLSIAGIIWCLMWFDHAWLENNIFLISSLVSALIFGIIILIQIGGK